MFILKMEDPEGMQLMTEKIFLEMYNLKGFFLRLVE